jgi:hypothetical protein
MNASVDGLNLAIKSRFCALNDRRFAFSTMTRNFRNLAREPLRAEYKEANEVTNPFVVTEVYVQQSDTWILASLSFTRLLTL